MPSYIQRPDADYSSTPNQLIYDKRFNDKPSGDKAKLLLVYAFAKPANWSYHIEHIADELGVSEKTIDRAIKTAKELGWLMTNSERKPVEVDGFTYWVTSSYWEVTIPEEAKRSYEALKRKWSDKKRSYSENAPKGSELSKTSTLSDPLSKTDSNKTEVKNNTPIGAVFNDSKAKGKKPAKVKTEEEASRSLVFSLYREVNPGTTDPDPEEALVAGMILRDEITHYLGKQAIPFFKQALVTARQRFDSGMDSYMPSVDVIAGNLANELLRSGMEGHV